MTAKLFALPQQVPLSNAGAVFPGAKASFFLLNSSTPQAVYTNLQLTIEHTNPVVADGFGRFPAIFLDSDLQYKMVLTDANDVEIYTINELNDPSLTGSELDLESVAPYVLFTETSASVGNRVWRIEADGEQFDFSIGDDSLTTFLSFMNVTRTGMNIDSINLTADALTYGSESIPTQSSGSFDATPTGVNSPVAGTINYSIDGNKVTFTVSLLVGGNSGSTAFTVTGMPSLLWPATQKILPTYVASTGIGNLYPAIVRIGVDGVMVFSMGTPFSETGFSNDLNIKGLPGSWTITYDLS